MQTKNIIIGAVILVVIAGLLIVLGVIPIGKKKTDSNTTAGNDGNGSATVGTGSIATIIGGYPGISQTDATGHLNTSTFDSWLQKQMDTGWGLNK